jgi:hypothetical protein
VYASTPEVPSSIGPPDSRIRGTVNTPAATASTQ